MLYIYKVGNKKERDRLLNSEIRGADKERIGRVKFLF